MKTTVLSKVLSVACLIFFLFPPTLGNAEVRDASRGGIETYGNVSFLIRIKNEHPIRVVLRNHSKVKCRFNENETLNAVTGLLKADDRNIVESGDHIYSFNIEYFSDLDEANHCLFGYQISFERNDIKLNKQIENVIGYENSNPLMKIMGMIHAEQNIVNELAQSEIKTSAQMLLNSIKMLQGQILNQLKNPPANTQ